MCFTTGITDRNLKIQNILSNITEIKLIKTLNKSTFKQYVLIDNTNISNIHRELKKKN